MRILVVALCLMAIWIDAAVSSSVNDIPVFTPSTNQATTAKTVLDPLLLARNPLRTSVPMAPPIHKQKLPTPMPTRRNATYPHVRAGNECGATYPYGSDAVSVERRGTFCAVSPVCAGAVVGKCPGVQPGLLVASRCEPVLGNVYGCVV